MNTATTISLASLLFLLVAGSLQLRADDKPLSEKDKIEALIKHMENLKEATFIRNGGEYNAKSAAKFLRGKWEKMGKEIKTASEFIEKIASMSSTTGKPYLIRFKDGREVKCGEYLKAELKKLDGEKKSGVQTLTSSSRPLFFAVPFSPYYEPR